MTGQNVDGVNVKQLVEAVRSGDAQRVRDMLEARPELVNTDLAENDERRAIHHAVLDRSVEMVRLLMGCGADAQQGIHPHRSATGALTLAVERGYDEIVAVIEEESIRRQADRRPDPDATGAAPSEQPTWGPLTTAVKEDRPDLLAELLEQGPDPDEPRRLEGLEEPVYSFGEPLWNCAVAGKHEMARTLLKRGADPNAMVYAGGTPVFQAYGQRDWEMIDLLEEYGGKADADTFGHYRRTEAAAQMLAETDVGLLPDGVEAKSALVEQMLWSAACGGDPEIVSMALARTDWEGDDRRWYRILEQPLRLWNHMPSFWANNEFDRGTYLTCFERVLACCDPNVRGRFGLTILHDLAAARAHVTDAEQVAFATRLLDCGAALDPRDDLLQSTPLGWACRWGRVELVKLLLEHGADPVEADAEPWATPRAWAEKRGHQDVLDELDGV